MTTMTTATATPCYATLHEEWLLNYKKALKDVNSSSATMMAMRASRMVPLQAADGAASQFLLQQMIFEMDRDAALLPLDNEKLQDLRMAGNEQESDNGNDSITNTADSFFDTYPECVRDAQGIDGDYDEEEEEEEVAVVVEKPPPIYAVNSYGNKHQQQQHQHGGSSPEVVVVAAKPPLRTNPYATAAPPRQQRAPQPPRNPYDQSYRPPSSNHSHNGTANQNQTSNHNAWDTVQNPFQSAKQFQYSNPNDSNNDTNDDTNRRNHQTRQQPQQQQPDELPQQRTNIPNSLKRKFQPPKRNVGDNKKKVGGSSGGAATARRPGSNDSKHGSGDSNNEDDDDELPEALKGLDKELIAKIENEILDSSDVITFDDIAGLNDAKQTVQELVCWPMKRPDLFTGLRRGPNGLLLYGPPGTGKTLIGKAVAHESGATFFSISSSSLTSKWIGEGEKLVRTLFAVAAYREPAVVFIDEIDSLLTQRKADENEASRRIKTEFLVQLDGTGTSGQGRVLVIGATNRPHELDDAARRRFVKRLYIPLPVAADRQILLRTLLDKNHHKLTDAELDKLSSTMTDGFSGADLKSLCVEAAMGPLRGLGARALEVDVKDVPPIAYKHFRQALRGMNASVSPDDLVVYIEWDKTYGSRRASAMNDEDDSDEE